MYCVQYTLNRFPDPFLYSDRCCFVWFRIKGSLLNIPRSQRWSYPASDIPCIITMDQLYPNYQLYHYIPMISPSHITSPSPCGFLKMAKIPPEESSIFRWDLHGSSMKSSMVSSPRSEPRDGPLPADRLPSRLRARSHGQCAVLAGRLWGAAWGLPGGLSMTESGLSWRIYRGDVFSRNGKTHTHTFMMF